MFKDLKYLDEYLKEDSKTTKQQLNEIIKAIQDKKQNFSKALKTQTEIKQEIKDLGSLTKPQKTYKQSTQYGKENPRS